MTNQMPWTRPMKGGPQGYNLEWDDTELQKMMAEADARRKQQEAESEEASEQGLQELADVGAEYLKTDPWAGGTPESNYMVAADAAPAGPQSQTLTSGQAGPSYMQNGGWLGPGEVVGPQSTAAPGQTATPIYTASAAQPAAATTVTPAASGGGAAMAGGGGAAMAGGGGGAAGGSAAAGGQGGMAAVANPWVALAAAVAAGMNWEHNTGTSRWDQQVTDIGGSAVRRGEQRDDWFAHALGDNWAVDTFLGEPSEGWHKTHSFRPKEMAEGAWQMTMLEPSFNILSDGVSEVGGWLSDLF